MIRAILFLVVATFLNAPAHAQIDGTPWKLEVEWEIGDEDSGVYFSFPNDLVIGQDGQLYLSDRQQSHITVLTRTGEEVMTIGQAGQGPGEFTEVTSLVAMPQGGVLVHDRRGGRMSQFDSGGKLMRTIIIPEVTSGLMWLAAYDEATDRVVFVKEDRGRDPDAPLVYWADLKSQTLGKGVLRPSQLLDIEDPVYAFSAGSILTYAIFEMAVRSGKRELVVFPIYYTGAWATMDYDDGILGEPYVFQPEKSHTLKHATKLDITDEEWRASRSRFGNAVGSYGQDGIHFADIHNFAVTGMHTGEDQFGIQFISEETNMDGVWMDVFSSSGSLEGRHPIHHQLEMFEGVGLSILAAHGLDEVYFRYYSKDRVPIIGRGRLVPQK